MRGRILDTMRGDPARAWDVGGILEATRIAGMGARDVGLALEGLASDGLIAELDDGRWGCRVEEWTSRGSAGGGRPPWAGGRPVHAAAEKGGHGLGPACRDGCRAPVPKILAQPGSGAKTDRPRRGLCACGQRKGRGEGRHAPPCRALGRACAGPRGAPACGRVPAGRPIERYGSPQLASPAARAARRRLAIGEPPTPFRPAASGNRPYCNAPPLRLYAGCARGGCIPRREA